MLAVWRLQPEASARPLDSCCRARRAAHRCADLHGYSLHKLFHQNYTASLCAVLPRTVCCRSLRCQHTNSEPAAHAMHCAGARVNLYERQQEDAGRWAPHQSMQFQASAAWRRQHRSGLCWQHVRICFAASWQCQRALVQSTVVHKVCCWHAGLTMQAACWTEPWVGVRVGLALAVLHCAQHGLILTCI